jgi:hypothetical protein
MTREQTINGNGFFNLTGWHFELLKTGLPIEVRVYRNHELLAHARDVEAGYAYRVPETKKPFTRIEVATTESASIKVAVSDGSESYKPRQPWYDRNPVEKALVYTAATVAPHADMTRWTYTVPSGKKFMLQTGLCTIYRDAAAAVAGQGSARVRVTPSGGSTCVISAADVWVVTYGAGETRVAGTNVVVLAGGVMDAVSSDGANGGSCQIRLTAQGVEFNA